MAADTLFGQRLMLAYCVLAVITFVLLVFLLRIMALACFVHLWAPRRSGANVGAGADGLETPESPPTPCLPSCCARCRSAQVSPTGPTTSVPTGSICCRASVYDLITSLRSASIAAALFCCSSASAVLTASIAEVFCVERMIPCSNWTVAITSACSTWILVPIFLLIC
jgi:hypothetical protein